MLLSVLISSVGLQLNACLCLFLTFNIGHACLRIVLNGNEGALASMGGKQSFAQSSF